MVRQGWKDVIITTEVHEQLSMLKAKRKKRSFNDLLKDLLKQDKE